MTALKTSWSSVQAVGSFWSLTPTATTTAASQPPSPSPLTPGTNGCNSPTGDSQSSHIKVLLSSSASGSYSVKQTAWQGGKKVPLRSLQHTSHSENTLSPPPPPPFSQPPLPSSTPSSVHNPLNELMIIKKQYVFIELFEAEIKSRPALIQLYSKCILTNAHMLCSWRYTHTHIHAQLNKCIVWSSSKSCWVCEVFFLFFFFLVQMSTKWTFLSIPSSTFVLLSF